jgi:hypothetical protein
MTQTLALLLDSYRELNAKRLFWIVLLISGIVVGACAMIGLKGDTLTVLWWHTPFKFDVLAMVKPALMYKLMFSYLGIGFWLAWIANILALISTAGIFPDFMAGGSIDLYLSKPISRLRLFLTKYFGGLLFVTLQASVFALSCFLLLGIRGGEWEPSIFLSIPLIVLVFSYLFSICVFLGVITKSTITALLLTLLLWFFLFGVQFAEGWSLYKSIESDLRVESLDRQISDAKARLASLQNPTTGPSTHRGMLQGFFGSGESKAQVKSDLEELQARRDDLAGSYHSMHSYFWYAMIPLPKTSATTDLIDRHLIKKADLPQLDENASDSDDSDMRQGYLDDGPGSEMKRQNRRIINHEVSKAVRAVPAAFILGTSIGFELVLVILSAWLFCRRDY